MSDKQKPKHPSDAKSDDTLDRRPPNDTGAFRWYQDLLDRILPKDKPKPPK
ncbi:MAG TPA: hypothetical protein VM009_07120 [Terriglobales bacterium]|nr:hypothetical protein [Terriglobales bacterium]